jgi:type IV pilus assembly protein PilN
MIRINLLSLKEVRYATERRNEMRVAYAVLAAAAVAVVFAFLGLNRLCAWREGQLAAVKADIEEVRKVVQEVEAEEQKRSVLQEKRRIIASLERKEVGPLKILEALSDSTPARLWLTEFADKGGEVSITGLAIDDPTVAEFLGKLQSSPHFTGLELLESAQADQKNDRIKKFVMKGPLNYSGETPSAVAQESQQGGKR